MKCPVCVESTLLMTERQGVEIDYCPQCRGVWLDRGELDKLIARSMEAASDLPAAQPASPWGRSGAGAHPHDHEDRHRGGHHDRHHGQRKSWLKDLFD